MNMSPGPVCLDKYTEAIRQIYNISEKKIVFKNLHYSDHSINQFNRPTNIDVIFDYIHFD